MYEASNFGFRSPKIFKNGTSTPSSSARSFKRKGSTLKFLKPQRNEEYHPQNNRVPKNSVYYDSSTPIKDQSFQHSIPTNQSQDSQREYSQKKSFRQSQYSISGFHNERKKYEHQITILKKDIERLKREIQLKDKQITQSQQNKSQYKQIQSELVETYRVINYYEGKAKEQQKILQYLQDILNNEVASKTKGKLKEGLDFKQIIEFFRNQSIELKGQLEKSNHQNNKITLKLQKLQNKYNNLQKSLKQSLRNRNKNQNDYEITNLAPLQNKKSLTIYETRLQSSQNRIGQRRGDDEASVTSSMRSHTSLKGFQSQNLLNQNTPNQQKLQLSKIYGNFNSKINKIEKELDFFKIENQKIQNELNQKIIQLGQLTLENDQLRFHLENNEENTHSIRESQSLAAQSQKEGNNSLSKIVTSMPLNFMSMKKTQSHQIQQVKVKQIVYKNSKSNSKPMQINSPQMKKNQLKNLSLNELGKKLPHSQSQPYKFKEITPQTIRKIRYHLIREDITYSKLLEKISQKLAGSQNPNEILQQLQDIPYQLNSKQSSSLVFEFKKIQAYLKEKELNNSMKNTHEPNKDLSEQQQLRIFKAKVKEIFEENIPPFKNITLRRDASMTSQITKTFKNRLAELEPYLRDKKKGIMSFDQAQKIFREEWSMEGEEVDFIFLKSCQESQQYLKFDFYKTIHFFLEN